MKIKTRRYIRINAQGKKLYKFINQIHDNNICCRRQFCQNDVFHGDILLRDLKKLRLIAEKNNIELKTAEYDSFSARAYRYRRRIGLILGAVIAVAAAFYFSRVIVSIEINGNSRISDEIILSALAELDIKQGTPIRNIDLPSCEKKLRLMIDDVAWAGIRHTGSRIVVQIREVEPIPDMVRDNIPCNIIASHDAEITSSLVRNGDPIHKEGDFVTKGTLLISGVYEDKKGVNHVCHAMGDVRGTYTETISFSGSLNTVDNLPTGRKNKKLSLKLFSLELPLSFGSVKFRNSSSTTSEQNLCLFGKELPIGIKYRTFNEMKLSDHTLSDIELSDRLMERVYLYEKNFLSDGTEIIDRSIKTVTSGDTLTLNVTYKLNGIISQPREILVK